MHRLYMFSRSGGQTYPSHSKKNILLPQDTFDDATWNKRNHNPITAIVPLVPPRLRPKDLSKYYILWEAEWDPLAPVDPFLLKRLTNRFFAVVAEWDLTPLERAVIEGTRGRRR